MGLDLIEFILCTEETFAIDLPDHECAQVLTVGDLYRLFLRKLDLTYQPATDIESHVSGRDRSRILLTCHTRRLDHSQSPQGQLADHERTSGPAKELRTMGPSSQGQARPLLRQSALRQ